MTTNLVGYESKAGDILVVKVDNKLRGKCRVVTDVPVMDMDDEHIQSALDVAKQMYG